MPPLGAIAGPLLGMVGGLGAAGIGAATQSRPYAAGKRYFDKDTQTMLLGELGRQANNWGDPTVKNYVESQPHGNFASNFAKSFGGAPVENDPGRAMASGIAPGTPEVNPDLERALGSAGYNINPANYHLGSYAPSTMSGQAGQSTNMYNLMNAQQQARAPQNVRFGYGGGNFGGYTGGYGGPLPMNGR